MSDKDSYLQLVCPMPECSAFLYVMWSPAYGLVLGDITNPQPIGPKDSDTDSWRVECVDGHVVLLPAPIGTCCDGEDCNHDSDWNEESRNFRASDLVRLGDLMHRLDPS